jgi:malate dehydrogenase (oxaloacetate-decarboxylating)(NADP+)
MPIATALRGAALLQNPLLNKGTAFSDAERDALGLRGLLPPHVLTIQEQALRVLENYRTKPTDLERFIQLMSLQDRNETLFYRVLLDNLDEMLPVVYTPTVGLACERFGHIFRSSRGLYLSIKDRGHVAEILRNWPPGDVRVIVMTDGERILGLGDQGVSGMGIPIGKLSVYAACAGIHPGQCLPVMLDVGTENQAHIADPLYLGLRQRRVRGPEYDAFIDEFVAAAQATWPKALLQFEDFGNNTAFHLLDRWRDRACTFNDDIQGTAAVTLAGLFSALRITGQPLRNQRVLFLGAGEAGVGIGDLIASAMVDDGMSPDEARRRCWFMDSQGLVVKSRPGLAAHKLRYAHESRSAKDLVSAIRMLEPTVLIGVSTVPNSFDRDVITAMTQINARPIIFALSNPTSKSECSAEQAYAWSDGKAIFASGSPFPSYVHAGQTFEPGQCNNCYIFPGVGLGVIASQATRISDRMFAEAARALAAQVADTDLYRGSLFPSLKQIRHVSANIAVAVAEVAFRDGLAGRERPGDVLAHVKSKMWDPQYTSYLDE